MKNAPTHFILDDPNLTKATALANWKENFTRQINNDFKNLTINVVDQKQTNLCVPISVCSLLRWAVKNDVGNIDEFTMKEDFSMEQILTKLTMIIYPRSLAGLNLNPKKEEQSFQENEIELLLKRLKFKTYLNKSGWEIIDEYSITKADFNFEKGKITFLFNFSLIF